MKPIQIHPLSALIGACVLGALFILTAMRPVQGGLTDEQAEILSHMSIRYAPDGVGGTSKTILITGVNVQIVNGLGATNGNPTDPDIVLPWEGDTFVNGLGNLVVGYNEMGNPDGDDRTGSHNIVFGHGNSYTTFGGIVGPHDSAISGPFATVTGGSRNRAIDRWCSVSGGKGNTAGGGGYSGYSEACSVSGGGNNTARGMSSSVSGGASNLASGNLTSVSGGVYNNASSPGLFGVGSSVSGGGYNSAFGQASSVSGGRNNEASSTYCSISGGAENLAAWGAGMSVSGGYGNWAGGDYSSVSGGRDRSVFGNHDWAAGSLFEED